MKAAKLVYDGINSELKEELPTLYDRSVLTTIVYHFGIVVTMFLF